MSQFKVKVERLCGNVPESRLLFLDFTLADATVTHFASYDDPQANFYAPNIVSAAWRETAYANALTQIAGAAQVDPGDMPTIGDNTGTPAAGLSLFVDEEGEFTQADVLMNDLATVQDALERLNVLCDEMRVILIAHDLMKGSA